MRTRHLNEEMQCPRKSALRASAHRAGVAVTELGRITAGEGARFLHEGHKLSFARPSYSHF